MPASPSTARAINDRLALRLLQQEGPLTAGQLKQLTGLSRPTVADLVERLTAAGLITVVGESGEQRRGPNARLYGIVADRAHLAALDVRTGGVVVLVSDLVGRVLAEASVPIGGDTGTGPAVEQAVAAVERTAKEAGADRLHTVGIGAPGLIDPATGDLRDSGGLPAWHRSLATALQDRLPGARVTVENETNLAALAEQREGAARDRDTFVLLWLGHGVGAAVVLDGTLRRGASGGTGEIGFLPVPGTASLPSARDCDGGFHSLAGASAIGALAAEHGLPIPPAMDGPGAAAVVERAVGETENAGAVPSGAVASGAARAGAVAMGAEAVAAGAGAPGAEAVAPGVARAEVVAPGVARAEAVDLGAGTPGGKHVEGVAWRGVTPGVARAGEAASDAARAGTPGVARAGAVDLGTGPAWAGEAASGADRAETPGALRSEGVAPAVATPGSEAVAPGVARAGTPGAARAVAPGAARADGQRRAGAFLHALADRIAVGAASVVAVLDPGCVVLGGEVGQAGGPVLAGLVEDRLSRMSPLVTEVRASTLGGAAVLRGALLTARDRAQDDLFAPPDRT
ncbi:ROK family protein [Streptomyces sp. NPDC007206]|uniref:ROK family protein n=1 Tax=Streptomyces sp. NPDC007206 TaxID=3154317 RepID=UPI0033F3E6A2